MKSTLPVLVVEDSFLIAASLEDALLEAGHPVTLARTVSEAEAAIADTAFAAALLDYVLPDGDSLGLARQLHASGCQVAVVSGVDREAVPSDRATAALFDKPTDERDLIAWVRKVTGTARASAA